MPVIEIPQFLAFLHFHNRLFWLLSSILWCRNLLGPPIRLFFPCKCCQCCQSCQCYRKSFLKSCAASNSNSCHVCREKTRHGQGGFATSSESIIVIIWGRVCHHHHELFYFLRRDLRLVHEKVSSKGAGAVFRNPKKLIGPRRPWGPIYGSWCLSLTEWVMFLKLN